MIFGVKLMFPGVCTKIRRVGNVAYIMKMRDEYKIWVEAPEGLMCFEGRALYGMILLKLGLQRTGSRYVQIAGNCVHSEVHPVPLRR
jgi:hypothetical protein